MSFLARVSLLNPLRREESKRRLAGLLRVSTYLTVVGCLSAFCLARAASARIDEAVQQFGQGLLQKLGPEIIGETQQIVVNGQRVMFSSQVSERPLSTTLDELQRHCDSVANPALAATSTLPAAAQRKDLLAGLEDPRRLTTDRYDTLDHAMGQVACIAHPQDGADLERALERALRFLETGDLSEVGDARYFLARKVTEQRTQVLSIWTEGRFDLLGMFPTEGDAPGSDSPVVPRPPTARRTFSAILPHRPYTVRMYESLETREAILAHYDRVMPADGWEEQPTSEGDELRVLTRAFSRGDTVAFVILDAARDGTLPVTLLEVGGQGFAHAAVPEKR
jgi:hypothetical protein